jgi:hypothetical protein
MSRGDRGTEARSVSGAIRSSAPDIQPWKVHYQPRVVKIRFAPWMFAMLADSWGVFCMHAPILIDDCPPVLTSATLSLTDQPVRPHPAGKGSSINAPTTRALDSLRVSRRRQPVILLGGKVGDANLVRCGH